MSEQLIAEIADILPQAGYSDRSRFIRDAIKEKIESLGVALPRGIALAPTRIGKAGRRKAPPDPMPTKRKN